METVQLVIDQYQTYQRQSVRNEMMMPPANNYKKPACFGEVTPTGLRSPIL